MHKFAHLVNIFIIDLMHPFHQISYRMLIRQKREARVGFCKSDLASKGRCQPILVNCRACMYIVWLFIAALAYFSKWFDKRHSNYVPTKMGKYVLHLKYMISLSFKFLTFIIVLRLFIISICFKCTVYTKP